MGWYSEIYYSQSVFRLLGRENQSISSDNMQLKFFLKSFIFLFHVLKTLKQASPIWCVGEYIVWAVTMLIFIWSQLLPRRSSREGIGG